MSSRLLTMKFMQRAAATTPTSSPASTPDHRSTKRRRLSNGSFQTSPATPGSDAEAVQQAIAAEDRKRQEAVDREAAKRGETKWILDVKTPQKSASSNIVIVSTGYSSLETRTPHHLEDQASDSDSQVIDSPFVGRKKFGTLPIKRTSTKPDKPESNGESSNESNEDEEDTEHHMSQASNGTGSMHGKKHQERHIALQKNNDRQKKPLKLDRLTSISNAGSGRSTGNITCHNCGKSGHIKAKCPQNKKR